MVAPVIAAGARFAPSLMNLGRYLLSPGPWKKTLMQQRAKGFGKEPITKEVQRRVAAGSAPKTVPAGGLGYGPTVSRGLGGRFAKGKMRVPVTKEMQKGLVQRHPFITAGIAAPFAYGAGKNIYGGLAGEEEAVAGTVAPPTPEWAAPEDLLSFSEQAKADAEKGKSDMKKMLKYGFLIAAAGGDPSKFFERASEVGKMTAAYTKDERYAKQYDAVFRKGDMPDTPQVAYRRLTDVGMGPKEAMEITGQVAQLMGKTETERALNNLRNVLASQGEEAAASLLMMYWSTGQLEGAPEYAKEDELRQAALAAVRGGGLGATEPTGEEIGEITLA
jgi:hypothetical protein